MYGYFMYCIVDPVRNWGESSSQHLDARERKQKLSHKICVPDVPFSRSTHDARTTHTRRRRRRHDVADDADMCVCVCWLMMFSVAERVSV